MYHWNAMMSPMDARFRCSSTRRYQVMTTLTLETSRPHDGPQHQLAPLGEELLTQHGVPAAHVVEQLAHLASEGAHDADAGERLADAAVDLLDVLAHRAVDRTNAAREDEAHEHRAGNHRQSPSSRVAS